MALVSNLNPVKPDLRSPAHRFRKGFAVSWARVFILLILDTGALTAAWLLASYLGTPAGSLWNFFKYPPSLVLILSLTISITLARGLYKAGSYRRNYLALIKAITLAQFLILLIAFLQDPKHSISRSTFMLSWGLAIAFVWLGRFIFDLGTQRLRQKGGVRYPVFVISDASSLDHTCQILEQEGRYILAGCADSTALDRNLREDTFKHLQELSVAEVFVAWEAIKNRLYLSWHFQKLGITLWILSSVSSSSLFRSEFCTVGDTPSFIIRTPTLIGSDYWIKRWFDFCFSLILLVVLSPILIFISILIAIDSPGPIFFKQNRVGLNGQIFKVWKYRTMVVDADRLQAALEAANEMKDGVLFKMKSDPRITRVGKFLRAYSLDELPQLINVLLGEMSFVGPRPLPVRDVERFKESYFIRQEVLPGITGLWQVSGRSNIDNFEDAVKLDLNYIENWSIWLDLKIILKTIRVVVQRSGAY